MRKKEILSVAMAAVLVMTPLATVKAEKTGETEPIAPPVEEEQASSEYTKTVGKITNIIKKDNGRISIMISEKEDNELGDLIAHIDETVLLVDSKTQSPVKVDSLKKGDLVEVFIKSNTPVTSSIPSQAKPQVVVLKNDDTFVNVDNFNSDLVNQANTLKLNVSEESVLIDVDGNKLVKEDLTNKDLVVFYGPATFSIPAQTNPIKVIALEGEETESELTNLSKVIINGKEVKLENAMYDLDGENMLPLRDISEKLGYEVKWNNTDRSIELTKGALWHRVKIGDNKYNFAKMLVELDQAPVLNKTHTFVPQSFLEEGLRVDVSIVDGVLNINN